VTEIAHPQDSKLVILDETEWGQTPVNGSARVINFIHNNLITEKDSVLNGQLNSDRMVSRIVEVTHGANSQQSFEISAGSHDAFLEAVLSGTWSRSMTFDKFGDVAWTANNTIVVSGADVTGYFFVGQIVKLEGFLTQGNNGYNAISTISFGATDTTITFTTSPGTIEATNGYAFLIDANDVVVQSSDIRLGTGGNSTIDSNGNNELGSFVVGQRIYLDIPTGSITFSNQTITFSATVTAGDNVSMTDGIDIISLFAGVDFATGATSADSATNICSAINEKNNSGDIGIRATVSGSVVTLYFLTNLVTAIAAEMVDSGGAMVFSTVSVASAAAARGFFTITAAGADTLTVTPHPPSVAVLGAVAIKGSVLKNPTDPQASKKSFTIEEQYEDLGISSLQDGMRVSALSLHMMAGQMVMGEVALEGRRVTPRDSILLKDGDNLVSGTVLESLTQMDQFNASSYNRLRSVTTNVIHCTANIGNISKDGLPMTTAVEKVVLDIDANAKKQFAVGTKYPIDVGLGRFEISGSLEAYFETLDLYNNFVNHDTISLSWNYNDLSGNVYVFTIPSVIITDHLVELRGASTQDVPAGIRDELQWMAKRDPITQCLIQIDRFSSVKPI